MRIHLGQYGDVVDDKITSQPHTEHTLLSSGGAGITSLPPFCVSSFDSLLASLFFESLNIQTSTLS